MRARDSESGRTDKHTNYLQNIELYNTTWFSDNQEIVQLMLILCQTVQLSGYKCIISGMEAYGFNYIELNILLQPKY